MKIKNEVKNFALIFCASSLPLLEIYRSNYFIFFDFEKLIYTRFTLIFLMITTLIFLLLNIYIIQNIKTALTIAVIFNFFFFYYQTIALFFYEVFKTNYSGALSWLFLLILICYIAIKLSDLFFIFFNSLFVFQIIFLLLTINSFLGNNIQESKGSKLNENVDFNIKPDIYFFLIDNLASEENLNLYFEQNFNFENIQNEEKNEFIIFDKSLSSYGRTKESISSMLDINYKLQGEFDNMYNLWDVINKNYESQNTVVENIFINNGYEIVKYGIAFPCEETSNIKCVLKDLNGVQTVSEIMISETPINSIDVLKNYFQKSEVIKLLFDSGCDGDLCRDPSLNDFKNSSNRPSVFLIHLMNVHGPFVVDSNCREYESIDTNLNVIDFPDSYIDSINCLILEMKDFINTISEDDIVIFQSDHGPEYSKMPDDYENLTNEDISKIKLRYQTFSFSNIGKFCQNIDKNFGGVNTFAYLFNCLAESNKFDLKSKAFYIDSKRNYKVLEITDIFLKK